MAVRLAVAEASPMVRLGYTHALAAHPDLELVGQAGTLAEAGRLATGARPDVVVLGAGLAGRDGFPAVLALGEQLRARRPGLGVVVIGPNDDALLFRALEERLSAYLPHTADVGVVLSAVRHAAVAPTAFTAPELAAALARRRAARAVLSPRENEVLHHLHRGANSAKIADSLRLTESTVRTYLNRVYDKLGVRSRAEAVVAASERGLL